MIQAGGTNLPAKDAKERGREASLSLFSRRFAAFFTERGLDPSCPALVAYSGGPDSTALLALLVRLGAGPLVACHVDHGIRAEAERRAEREIVTLTADMLGVPLLVADIRPGAVESRARRLGSGLEAAARWYRQRALGSRLRERGLGRLYLGHTADDSLESLLMGFLGGAGPAGLKGIPAVSGRLVRPLSGFGKKEILSWLEAEGLPYSTDSSNSDLSLRRNRVRGLLVPLLDREFAGWRKALESGAHRYRLDEELLSGLTEPIRFLASDDGSLVTQADTLLEAPPALAFRALVAAYARLDLERPERGRFAGGRVPSRMVLRALETIGKGRSYSAHGLELLRDSSQLRLRPALDFGGRDGYFVVIEEKDVGKGRELLPGLHLETDWDRATAPRGIIEGCFEFPVILRNRRPGDRLAQESGSKSVDELLAEWRVPLRLRDRVPVVQDRRGLVALLGSGFPGGRDRHRAASVPITPDARSLVIELKGERA